MFKKYLIMFLISMVPIVELRGAIPYAAVFGIPTFRALIICMIGNMLPVPVIYWFARRVLPMHYMRNGKKSVSRQSMTVLP